MTTAEFYKWCKAILKSEKRNTEFLHSQRQALTFQGCSS